MEAALSLFKTGRPVLFAALKDVCDQIETGLVAEQDNINQMNKRMLKTMQEGEAEISKLHDRLEEVTAERDAAVAALPAGTAASLVDPQPAPSASAPAPDLGDAAVVKSEFLKLQRRFNALSANFKIAKSALQKRKDERDKWMQHALNLDKQIMAAEKEHGIQILQQKDQLARVSRRIPNAVDEAGLEQSIGHGGSDSELPFLAARNTHNEERMVPNVLSDSTQGEVEDGAEDQLPHLQVDPSNDPVSVKQEPSSDVPLLVSERAVKKRKCATGTDAREPRVKSEPRVDSSPMVSKGRYAFNTQESLDLGDIEQRMTTPRKRKELEQSLERPNSRAERKASELDTSAVTPVVAASRCRHPPQSAPGAQRPSVLTPLSANIRTARSGGTKPNARNAKRDLGYALSVLAEDGDDYKTDTSTARTKNSNSTVQPTHGLLSTLLNSPPVAATEEVILRRAGQRVTGKRKSPGAAKNAPLPIPERRELPFEKGAAVNSPSPQIRRGLLARSDLSLIKQPIRQKSPRRIRTKPYSDIRLDDFKINPQANDGHDFAYADVVRGKGERACLPGCTDMYCCGKEFRALALSQRPNPPLTPAQRIEERKLLEEFLGEHAYRLISMNKEEREDLWVEAKTAELANKYGKHRHRFSRMQSPPGFWNADFPSTQEREADREEAARREERAIRDRYRSAMVPGGRWMFKDE